MWDYGDDRWPHGLFGVLMGIGWGITAFIGFLIWVTVIILLVRFLLIGTRAAKVYLTQNGHEARLFPRPPVPPTAPAAPAAAARTTTPAPANAPTKPAPTKPVAKPPTKPLG